MNHAETDIDQEIHPFLEAALSEPLWRLVLLGGSCGALLAIMWHAAKVVAKLI
jgi:hypothetical protein